MMMNFLHTAFALELIALVLGVTLLIYIHNQTKIKSKWAHFVAWFVIIASAVLIICSIVTSFVFWQSGDYSMYHHRMMERYEHMNRMDNQK